MRILLLLLMTLTLSVGCTTEEASTSQVSSHLLTDPPTCFEWVNDQLVWSCGPGGPDSCASEEQKASGDARPLCASGGWDAPFQRAGGSGCARGQETDPEGRSHCNCWITQRWQGLPVCEIGYCGNGVIGRTGNLLHWYDNFIACPTGAWYELNRNIIEPQHPACPSQNCFIPPPPPPPPPVGGGPVLPPGDGGPCHGSRCPVEQGDAS